MQVFVQLETLMSREEASAEVYMRQSKPML